ncbi:MarR family transcriptional regulator [Luteimicrobium album]|uniref:MarR family transcriptional regulator n=1 Tax=Luteimicrobium album TaxID=1054550 RepID=A0ABQ6I3A8_9MICO|nr:MarR family transcriptional regulator [Luteimicrobium album]GMA24952.1 MarR family transcriptional regulator [Luteimicrobium album]
MTIEDVSGPATGRHDDDPGGPQDDAAAAVLSRIEYQVAQLMRRADRSVSRGSKRPGTGTMDRAAYLLLHHLVSEGAENVNVLADRLGLDASTVTRQVAVLEKAGHVRRTRDPHDGRAVLVEPTDEGVEALAENRTERRALYGEVLGSWTRLDRALLAELLGRLNSSLTDYRRRAED